MPLSPQSQAVVDQLLAGRSLTSGRIVVGPLDRTGSVLLQVLLDSHEDLSKRSGADQAATLREAFRSAVEEQSSASEPGSGAPAPTAPAEAESVAEEPTGSPSWRLMSVECTSFRGVAPAGDTLEFRFDGQSNLLFGPNGSGKSSLLGAVVWVLAGKALADTEKPEEVAPVYSVSASSARGRKLRDWPIAATLPENSIASQEPSCEAQILLRTAAGDKSLHLKRSIASGLESSLDGRTWTPCPNLSEFGIRPLDLQLSLLAPTVFGRKSVESAADTRQLLSLMLGYDDIEMLGELASRLAGNRTRLANTEERTVDTEWGKLGALLAGLPEKLPKGSPLRTPIEVFAKDAEPALAKIAEVGQRVADDIQKAESELAKLLGLPETPADAPGGLADRLITAMAGLAGGTRPVFPSVAAVDVGHVLPPTDAETPRNRLDKLGRDLATFLQDAKARILKRLEWWRRETAPGSKDTLLLEAARYYDPETAKCPVCEQSVDHLPVKEELAALGGLDPELSREIADFFSDLAGELDEIVPASTRDLSSHAPAERLSQDWDVLKSDLLGKELGPLSTATDKEITSVVEGIAVEEAEAPGLVPDDADDAFKKPADGFLEAVHAAQRAERILAWSADHLEGTLSRLHGLVTATPEESGTSMLASLSGGRQAAESIRPLRSVRDDLRQMHAARKMIAQLADQRDALVQLEPGLNALKGLSKYAEAQVLAVFSTVRDRTLENWKLLYPESSSGLEPSRLILGRGRDKSVEAVLAQAGYEVPEEFFGNAGLQRAVALSFFFALLDQHPKGLGFVIMDDPILSLDDDHRESWSCSVLKPKMEDLQVILATHQRQYLNNCQHDFGCGQVVELNPRSWPRRISWRPGSRLERAKEALEGAWTQAPNELRKYGESVLLTLESYSPAPFVNPRNLAGSLATYGAFASPHALASTGQQKIASILEDPKVNRVLNPGSHHLTEADVTQAMIGECLGLLRRCDSSVKDELRRLERIRQHARRGAGIPVPLASSVGVPREASWADPVQFAVLGRAAAKPDSMVVDGAEEVSRTILGPGGAILVSGNSLEPVARPGQWVILAPESTSVIDGDLVAAETIKGDRLLRRVWSDDDNWILESVVCPVPCVRARKTEAALRKAICILYEPQKDPGASTKGTIQEWQPRADFDKRWLESLKALAVEGDSLDPVARKGQKVLVAEQAEPVGATIPPRSLAAIATRDEDVGNVIKRVFPGTKEWTLVSPNPVDGPQPIRLSVEMIESVWLLRGVILSSADIEDTQ